MMYPYMILSDETDVVYSNLLIDEDGQEYLEVHFERPMLHGFDSARCRIPEYRWLYNDGYSEEDITSFTDLIKQAEKDLFERAKEATQRLTNEGGKS